MSYFVFLKNSEVGQEIVQPKPDIHVIVGDYLISRLTILPFWTGATFFGCAVEADAAFALFLQGHPMLL